MGWCLLEARARSCEAKPRGCGHWPVNRDVVGVAAGESHPQMGGRFMDSLARDCLVWAFDAGCSHARMAYDALWALDGNTGARAVHSVGLLISGFGMGLFVRPVDGSGGGGGFDLCGGSGSVRVCFPDGGSDDRRCRSVIPGRKRIFRRWL